MPGPEDPSANWRFNSSGQFANQEYLADEIARLNIASSEADRADQSQNSKPAASVQFQENSSLDSSADSSSTPDGQAVHSRNSSSGAPRMGAHAVSPSEGRSSRGRVTSPASAGLRQGSNGVPSDQPSYPSLANAQRASNSQNLGQANGRGHRGGPPSGGNFGGRNNQYNRVPQQIQVGLPQQGLVPSPTALGYPAAHAGHLSLGTPQQLYDMMVPVDPTLSRVQQHNLRGNHQHSTSDPTSLHEQTQLNNYNAQMFNPQLAGPLSLYTNQYYPNQEAYRADLAAQTQAMLAARLQQQYSNQYGASPPTSGDPTVVSPSSSSGGNGPSANNRKLGLYKTELCRSWEEKHTCRYGAKCQFAHGEEELKNVSRHPKYKTEICRTFWVSGSCPYGKRCCFIHTELPHAANGAMNPPAAGNGDGVASPTIDGRPRSQSNSSDPNEPPKSLLARISTGRESGSTSNSATPTPIDSSTSSNFPYSRPATGSLRVDTKSLDSQAYKTQNKSAFPVFPNGRSVQPAPEPITAKSPVQMPVTAGPDFGRHAASRAAIVGQNERTRTPTAEEAPSSSSNHQRSSSGANWRGRDNVNNLASPAGENISSPWTTQELVAGGSRQRPW